MSVREGLIVALPQQGEPLWMRVVEGAVVQSGTGANWLAACGLTALPDDAIVLLVPPAALVTLNWIEYPDLAPRQGRAAARLAALAGAIVPADQLFAAADENEDRRARTASPSRRARTCSTGCSGRSTMGSTPTSWCPPRCCCRNRKRGLNAA